ADGGSRARAGLLGGVAVPGCRQVGGGEVEARLGRRGERERGRREQREDEKEPRSASHRTLLLRGHWKSVTTGLRCAHEMRVSRSAMAQKPPNMVKPGVPMKANPSRHPNPAAAPHPL